MSRHKLDRSNKIMQSFESTKPLKTRLESEAAYKNITLSALIREILEKYFEDKH